jgi:hypothetical protein
MADKGEKMNDAVSEKVDILFFRGSAVLALIFWLGCVASATLAAITRGTTWCPKLVTASLVLGIAGILTIIAIVVLAEEGEKE